MHRDEKETRKSLREPHNQIYEYRPLKVQPYLYKIRFIKLCRQSFFKSDKDDLRRDIILH